jgi:hypothetical protein
MKEEKESKMRKKTFPLILDCPIKLILDLYFGLVISSLTHKF